MDKVITVKTTLSHPDPDKRTVTQSALFNESSNVDQDRGNSVTLGFPDGHADSRMHGQRFNIGGVTAGRCDALGGTLPPIQRL